MIASIIELNFMRTTENSLKNVNRRWSGQLNGDRKSIFTYGGLLGSPVVYWLELAKGGSL